MPLPRNGARSPSGMPEADAEGVFSLVWIQYDMIKEGTDIEIEFCILIFEFRPHSPKPPAGRIRNQDLTQNTFELCPINTAFYFA